METLTAGLQLDISAFSAALQQAGQRVQQFAQSVTSQMQQATASLSSNTTATQANAAANNALLIAMQNLQGTARQQLSSLQQLTTQTQQHAAATQQSTTATASWGQALSVAAGLGIATSIGSIVTGLKNMAVESVQLAVKMQSLTMSFKAITGSSAAAAKELSFIRDVATKTGTDFFALANSFKNFESASKGTSLEGEKAKMVFEGLATASRVMGLSAEQTSHALLALEQMVSKGRVSMEELRRQLGNALPGGFQIAARAMNATTEELNKMVKEGLNAEEFVTRFGRQLTKEFGPGLADAAKTAAATFARLGNEVQALGVQVGNALLTMFQPIASFIERTLRSMREAQAEAQRLRSQAGAEALAGKPIIGYAGTAPALEPGATAQETARGLELEARMAALKKAIPAQEAFGIVDFFSARSKKALADAEEAYRALNAQIRERNTLLRDQSVDPFEAKATAGVAIKEAEAKRLKAIATATSDARKEMEGLGTTLKELGAAGASFPALIAGKEGQLDMARDRVREIEKAIGKVSESLQVLQKAGATPPEALQKQMQGLNTELATANTNVTRLEDAIATERKNAREGETARKKALTDNLRFTQEMIEETARITQGEAAERLAALDNYLKKARAAKVEETVITRYEAAERMAIAVIEARETLALHDKRLAQEREDAAIVERQTTLIEQQRRAMATLAGGASATDTIEKRRLAAIAQIDAAEQNLYKNIRDLGERSVVSETEAANAAALARTEINQKAVEDIQKQEATAAQKALRPWRQLAEDIEHTLSTAFENVLAGTFSVWDGIKRGFIKLLADLTATALTQQILIPVAMDVMGASGGLTSAFLGAGGTASMGGATDTGGTAETAGGGGSLSTALGFAQSGASIYQGVSGQSFLGSNSVIKGFLDTPISSLFGGAGSAAAYGSATGFGGGATGATMATADIMGAGESGSLYAASGGAEAAPSALGASIGSVVSGAGVGIAAGQIFAKLNAMMGLHGTGNKVLSGAGGGAIAGAMIGSAIPVIGTAIGAIIGTAVGALGGYISSLFGPGKPKPMYDPTAVQAAQVAYNPTQGLQLTATMGITRDIHRDVGGLQGWQATVKTINEGLADMAQQVVGQFQGVAPELQQALVDPLNTAFNEIAAKIGGLKIAGDTVEEFTANLQEMMGTTLPGYFNDAMTSVVAKLQETVKKIEPVFNAFNAVIETLQKDIDAIHGQQLDMHNTLQAAKNALSLELKSPAEAFLAAQGQYGRAREAFGGANAQQQILMAPALAQAAQQLLSMSKSDEVLGQDKPLVKALQTSLLADLDMLQVRTDSAFDSMTQVLQQQVDAAEAQKKALVSGLANPASLDQVIASSLSALTTIQDAIAASQGEQDPLVQAQVVLLGGLTNIGTAQLQQLQDISSKLGGGVGSFADGSQYVPQNMLAYIHAGERISPASNNYGGDTIHVSVNVNGSGSSEQTANQIANAVIAEIEKRGGRYGTTTILTRK